jgi:hypothetical protein
LLCIRDAPIRNLRITAEGQSPDRYHRIFAC